MTICGIHGRVAEIAQHGSVLLSRDRLITVVVPPPQLPRTPSSIQRDTVVKEPILFVGFPPEFVNAFKNGFPHNWLSLVADFFNSQSRLVINLFLLIMKLHK